MTEIINESTMLEKAQQLCMSKQRASVSMVQRHLNIGYDTAKSIVSELVASGALQGLPVAGLPNSELQRKASDGLNAKLIADFLRQIAGTDWSKKDLAELANAVETGSRKVTFDPDY